MNKVLTFLLIAFTAAQFSCGSGDDGNDQMQPVQRDLDSIQNEGTLRVLINYSGTSYFLYRGQPMGFDYELLTNYAEHAGLKLELIPIQNMDSVFYELNNGKGDIVAANLTITKDRLKEVGFTAPILVTQQVLIQRKPDNWRSLSKKNLQKELITSTIDLSGKMVIVRKGSSFYPRLKSLSDEIGGNIIVKTVPGDYTMEQLIKLVSIGKIDYTIADKNIAMVNQYYYQNIDAELPISNDQQIAWAVRTNADSLTTSINQWLEEFQQTKKFKRLHTKYFKNQQSFSKRMKSDYYTLTSGKISKYDELFMQYAPEANLDWHLLASLVYQESHFNNNAIGWGGAFGLMQFMPKTGERYGVNRSSSPEANVKAGIKYINRLNSIWEESVPDSLERIKFVIASYNVGPGHILDAQKLAKKYGKNPAVWTDNVDYFLLHKSEAKYYKDPVVKHGYCKGFITYDYVKEIIARSEDYKNIYSEVDTTSNPLNN